MEELSAGSNLLSEQVDDPAAAGGADLLSLFQVSGLSAYVSAAAGRTSGALAGRKRVKRHEPRQGRSVLMTGRSRRINRLWRKEYCRWLKV